MSTSETYRGVVLRARALPRKSRRFGDVEYFVNGESWGYWMEPSEQSAIDQMKRYVDEAAKRPEAYPQWVPLDEATP